jgi:hypothetical protein
MRRCSEERGEGMLMSLYSHTAEERNMSKRRRVVSSNMSVRRKESPS